MKIISWIKERFADKWDHIKALNLSNLLDIIKEHGLALVLIMVGWEIIEDILFPLLFIWLGTNIHPIFLAAAPLSLVLCVHWLAVPILWKLWIKIKGKPHGPGI